MRLKSLLLSAGSNHNYCCVRHDTPTLTESHPCRRIALPVVCLDSPSELSRALQSPSEPCRARQSPAEPARALQSPPEPAARALQSPPEAYSNPSKGWGALNQPVSHMPDHPKSSRKPEA